MAQYKVPQDVEADDKLLGPFSFRQFVYLLIAGGLLALAIGLFQLFPLLAIIPLPPIILFVALALPLRKDQPMETYLAALVSYYLKPHVRLWTPGQRDSVIRITAPKKVEESRTRDISGEEANHRLSFLADIVDTGGYAIKGTGSNNLMREDLVAEASTAVDMFEGHHFDSLANAIQKDETERHAEVVREMQEAINTNNNFSEANAKIQKRFENLEPSAGIQRENSGMTDSSGQIPSADTNAVNGTNGASTVAVSQLETVRPLVTQPDLGMDNDIKYASSVVVMPDISTADKEKRENAKNVQKNAAPKPPKSSIIELANNPDFSVETIAKEAKRINEREGEVFISLH